MPASPAAAAPAAEEETIKRKAPVFKAKQPCHSLNVVRNVRFHMPAEKQLANSVAIATQDEVRDVFTQLADKAFSLLPRGRRTLTADQFMAALKVLRVECEVSGRTSLITSAVLKECEKEYRAITAEREAAREERRAERAANPKPKKGAENGAENGAGSEEPSEEEEED